MYNEQTGKPGSHSEKIHICQQIKTAVSITEAAVFCSVKGKLENFQASETGILEINRVLSMFRMN